MFLCKIYYIIKLQKIIFFYIFCIFSTFLYKCLLYFILVTLLNLTLLMLLYNCCIKCLTKRELGNTIAVITGGMLPRPKEQELKTWERNGIISQLLIICSLSIVITLLLLLFHQLSRSIRTKTMELISRCAITTISPLNSLYDYQFSYIFENQIPIPIILPNNIYKPIFYISLCFLGWPHYGVNPWPTFPFLPTKPFDSICRLTRDVITCTTWIFSWDKLNLSM